MSRLLHPAVGTGAMLAMVAGLSAVVFSIDPEQAPALPSNVRELAPAVDAPAGAFAAPRPRNAIYYAAITDRPLFAPTRRPDVMDAPPGPEAEPEPDREIAFAPPPPQVRLLGVLQTGTSASALLSIEGGAPVWVPEGADIEGWRMSEVSATSVVLTADDRSLRLEMYPQ
ncbi:MAG: hypothetical protein JJ859_18385 [Roseicyclus sp.]|nr:hypothetical protein [Roseicyclus sp.]